MSSQINLTEQYQLNAARQSETAALDLYVLFSPRSFSFLILDSQVPEIVEFAKYTFDEKVNWKEVMKEISIQRPVLLNKFLNRHVIFRDNIYTLVPYGLFDKDNLDLYLQFNHTIGNDVNAYFDRIKMAESYLIYVAPKSVFDWIYDNYEKVTVRHHNSILTDFVFTFQNKESSAKTLYVHIWEDNLDILHIKENRLIFLNTFTFSGKEELIYFILFTAKQLKLPLHQLRVELMGEIDSGSELFQISSRYIKLVHIHQPPEVTAKFIPGQGYSPVRNFIIQNAFLCE